MKKKHLQEKIDLFKKSFPDYKVSKNNNLYIEFDKKDRTYHKIFNSFMITKNKINDFGKKYSYTKSYSDIVLLLSTTGVLQYKRGNLKFKRVSLKDMAYFSMLKGYRHILEIFLNNKKYKYIEHYPHLFRFKIVTQFSSFKELKDFLGFQSMWG